MFRLLNATYHLRCVLLIPGIHFLINNDPAAQIGDVKSASAYTSYHHPHSNNTKRMFLHAADSNTDNQMSRTRRKQISFAVGTANYITTNERCVF
jgi:hypothetical protein